MRGRKGVGDVPVYDMEARGVSMLVRDFAIIVGAGDERSWSRKTSRQQSLPGARLSPYLRRDSRLPALDSNYLP